jgi:hypothetical protein
MILTTVAGAEAVVAVVIPPTAVVAVVIPPVEEVVPKAVEAAGQFRPEAQMLYMQKNGG